MAEYIAPHLTTPIFIMNSAYDAYQLPQILKTPCGLGKVNLTACSAEALAEVQTYAAAFKTKALAAVKENKGPAGASGAFVDSCWVHEQNVEYCSNQGVPNCVGWTPSGAGAKKWAYTTSVKHGGQEFTPQQAFAQYYASRKSGSVPPTCKGAEAKAACWAVVDETEFPDNDSCKYRTKPAS